MGRPVAVGGEERLRALRFVGRVYRLRALGLGLGFFCVASVLRLDMAPLGWWVALAVNAYLWPHVAYLLARHDRDPQRAEMRNLMVDSALGGLWIAVMQFNLLPSVLVVTMLSVDKVSVGGLPLLARTSVVLVAVCAATSAILGFPVELTTPMPVIVACLPFLAAYPLAISSVTHALSSRVVHQNKLLAALGRTDHLTGLANRRHALTVAAAEFARFQRTGRPAVLMMIDIDNFKPVNDLYGHPAGDEVLCGMAAILRSCCRSIDTPARYGGDEFMVVVPETTLVNAAGIAERIRVQFRAFMHESIPDANCTASFGAAEASSTMSDGENWVHEADAALYDAKTGGRDRYVGAPVPPPSPDPESA